jgi:hypothetical protein
LISGAKSNYLLKDVSKRQLEAKIKNIAVKEKRGNDTVSLSKNGLVILHVLMFYAAF